ncbi:hypothetical protein FRC17_002389 [Serendipita sp. 399]|nr:hypothetical protein FRC17_002389 [Serendipita sp. 399]
MDPKELETIMETLEEESTLKEKIRDAGSEMEKFIRVMMATLTGIHSTRKDQLESLLKSNEQALENCKAPIATIAKLIPKHQYWRWKDLYARHIQNLVFIIVLSEYLNSGKLASIQDISDILGLEAEWHDEVHVQIEDYLQGIISSRFAINSVTLGNFEEPFKIQSFANDVFAGFSMLSLKNDNLRRRFDSLKYDLKRIEEVVYDLRAQAARLEATSSSLFRPLQAMAARKAFTKNEADSGAQLQSWQAAYASLTEIAKLPDVSEAIARANKYIQQLQAEYNAAVDQSATELKPARTRVKGAVAELKNHSQTEIANCDKALAHIDNLLKAASETSIADGRPKRTREASTNSVVSQQSTIAPNQPVSGAASTSSHNGLTSKQPPIPPLVMSRIQKQLPLQPGRKVAFRMPSEKSGKSTSSPTGTEAVGYEEDGWILATVFKHEKNRYIVQDVESETGELPKYTTNIRSLIPLPIADVPPSNPNHLDAYPEYKSGSTVLALFPDTTSFYKAVVVASPKEILASGTRSTPAATKAVPCYEVRFEDDDDQVRSISAEEVIEFPGW